MRGKVFLIKKREALKETVILAAKFGETEKLKHTGKVRAKWQP